MTYFQADNSFLKSFFHPKARCSSGAQRIELALPEHVIPSQNAGEKVLMSLVDVFFGLSPQGEHSAAWLAASSCSNITF